VTTETRTDFAQRVAEWVAAIPELAGSGYVASDALPAIRRLLAEHADLDTLAREIALGFWRKHWISEPDVFPVAEKDKQRVDRLQDEAQAILAPYFAARDERDEQVRQALNLCVIELAYLKEQVKARPRGSVDQAHQAGTKALALLQPDQGGEM